MLAPFLLEDEIEAGCDEAGRGCLAGPVTAAAVILPENFSNNLQLQFILTGVYKKKSPYLILGKKEQDFSKRGKKVQG